MSWNIINKLKRKLRRRNSLVEELEDQDLKLRAIRDAVSKSIRDNNNTYEKNQEYFDYRSKGYCERSQEVHVELMRLLEIIDDDPTRRNKEVIASFTQLINANQSKG